ncbi:hypothetical protein BDZ85DRAFT_307740 [Elsinoe ampelina]|uniref:Uncharacterized protein n=1 Tax=Elsinoe ampelina TaxID=302913 RepID=A0A6A6GJ47_9PEZI|nr:hypothetical protein BDZ85DRAFT_307740 [Elsinoe ampelina]
MRSTFATFSDSVASFLRSSSPDTTSAASTLGLSPISYLQPTNTSTTMTAPPTEDDITSPPSHELSKLRQSNALLLKANTHLTTRSQLLSTKLLTSHTRIRDLKTLIADLEAEKEDLLALITKMEVEHGMARIEREFEHEMEVERRGREGEARVRGLEEEVRRERETAERKVRRVREFYEGLLVGGIKVERVERKVEGVEGEGEKGTGEGGAQGAGEEVGEIKEVGDGDGV